MSDESNITDQTKLIAALQEIKTIAEECIRAVGERSEVRRPRKKLAQVKHAQVKRPLEAVPLSFNTNRLAFMKKHARGLSGRQKFTLLLAHLGKRDISQQVSSAEVEKHWNKMKVVLGGKYNGVYANRAKAEGWVETPKHGVYTLSAFWKDSLTKGNE